MQRKNLTPTPLSSKQVRQCHMPGIYIATELPVTVTYIECYSMIISMALSMRIYKKYLAQHPELLEHHDMTNVLVSYL